MKLTTRGRYAVTAMVDIALHAENGNNPVPLADISRRQEISLSYLEQLFSRLRRNKLVDSTRGPGGGYRIARPLDKVAVADIVEAVNESVDATQCGGQKNCHQHGRCLTHDLWEGLSRQIESFLQSVSLHDLVSGEPLGAQSRLREQTLMFREGRPLDGDSIIDRKNRIR